MKQVLIDRYGTPWDVARCADVPDVGEPAADEVVLDVLAFPINPADMWFCKGSYRLKPPLPATPGAECVGRVAAVGSAVKHVKTGDLVINLQRENWTQRRRVKGDDAIPLPSGIDLRQAAMVRINPPTVTYRAGPPARPAYGECRAPRGPRGRAEDVGRGCRPGRW